MIIIDNILKEEFCSSLIQYFENNKEHAVPWCGTEILMLESAERQFLNKLNFVYTSYLNNKGLLLCSSLTQIVKWPVGVNKNPHLDDSRETDRLTSVTYLNEDYHGGETCLEGIKVKPEIGKTIFFDGTSHKHWVTEVKEKPRYALTLWYTDDINLIY